MPVLTIPITNGRPIIPIVVTVSSPRGKALIAAGREVPAPLQIFGLIDTGASCTAVDSRVIERLELTPTGTTEILTPSTGPTPHTCNQYDIGLTIEMDQHVHSIPSIIGVIESNLSAHGIEALIGCDVLENAILIYNGKQNSLSLAF